MEITHLFFFYSIFIKYRYFFLGNINSTYTQSFIRVFIVSN